MLKQLAVYKINEGLKKRFENEKQRGFHERCTVLEFHLVQVFPQEFPSRLKSRRNHAELQKFLGNLLLMRDTTDERLQYMREVSINFDSKTIEFIGDYKNLLSYVIGSELNFQNRMKSFNSEFLEKDFPNLEVAKITSYNVLYRDKSLTQFKSSNTSGGYFNNTELCYICVKSKSDSEKKEQLKHL